MWGRAWSKIQSTFYKSVLYACHLYCSFSRLSTIQNIILAVPSFSLSNVINVALQNTLVGGKGRMYGIYPNFTWGIYSSFSWSSDFSSFLSPLSSACSPSSLVIIFAALSTSVGLVSSKVLFSLSRVVLSGKLKKMI